MINIVTHIKNLAIENKLPNAILIIDENNKHGYNLIKSIAFWILCIKKTNAKICKCCDSCRPFLKGHHPDYHEIYSKNEIIKLEHLKNTLDYLHYKPTISKNKIITLGPVNLFSNKASNAILKTLEEPPQNALFLLVSHKQHILSTIKDRCQTFNITCKTKLKSYNIMRFLYQYLIFNNTNDLSKFITQIENNNKELILDSIYIFLLRYIKKTYAEKKTLYIIDKLILLQMLRRINQTKYLLANHLNPKIEYTIENILKTIKTLLLFSIKNNQTERK